MCAHVGAKVGQLFYVGKHLTPPRSKICTWIVAPFCMFASARVMLLLRRFPRCETLTWLRCTHSTAAARALTPATVVVMGQRVSTFIVDDVPVPQGRKIWIVLELNPCSKFQRKP